MFYSIQGEGPRVGTPSMFVRFAECNLHCPWCDTDHVAHKNFSSEEGVVEAIRETYRIVGMPPFSTDIVLTGGEPMLQIKGGELVYTLLAEYGLIDRITVETNGTVAWGAAATIRPFVVVSPKPKSVLRMDYWSAMKIVVSNKYTDKQIAARAIQHRIRGGRAGFFLQPDFTHYTESLDRCLRLLQRHPDWRLSLQTHKMIGVA
jgi:organic radical activating enzyme